MRGRLTLFGRADTDPGATDADAPTLGAYGDCAWEDSLASTSTRRTADIAFLFALAVLVAINGEALSAWLRLWAFSGLEYGFAILGVSFWLLWRSRDRLRRQPVDPDWRRVCVLVPVALASWVAYAIDIRIAQYALFILGVAALAWTLLGPAVLRVAAGPLIFFGLALPFWNYFTPVLQAMTVRVTGFALEITGTPVFVDETYIYTPRGTFLVLAGCSGVQFFQAGVTIGALYAYLGFRSLRARAVVLLSFIAIALLANWVRVFSLAFLGALTDQQHFLFGWGIFTGLLLPAFWLAGWAHRIDEESAVTVAPSGRLPSGGRGLVPPPSRGAVIATGIIATLLLAFGPLAIYFAAPPAGAVLRLVPKPARPPWSGPYAGSGDWQPSFVQPDAQGLATYRTGAREVTAYCACYLVQRQGSKVINETNTVYDAARWRVRGGYAGTVYREVALADGATLRIIETRLENPKTGAERLAWHWYEVSGRSVAQPVRAKFAQLLGRFSGRQAAAAFVVSTDGHDVDTARLVLLSFLRSNLQALQDACQPAKSS